MRKVLCPCLLICILFLCPSVIAQPLGQMADSSNDGGFTAQDSTNPGMFKSQLIPSDNDGGFTRETVYQQQVVHSQPVSSYSGGNSWETPGSSFLTQKPGDFGQLTETGTAPGFTTQTPTNSQPGPNGLWIVDATGLNRYPEMSVPLFGYAREEITPSVEGQITIEEMYPNGEIRTFGMGYVQPYHVYKMWFYGDVPGTHMIRYNINGYYSNIVRFYVQVGANQGPANQGVPSQGVSTGTSIVRSGNTISRSSGSYSSGYSSTSSSGGSMSISTSFG
jgi:hypothetical protein